MLNLYLCSFEFVKRVTGEIIAGRGDLLPVSAMPIDGAFPVGTAAFEKRNLALKKPILETDFSITQQLKKLG
ncbi:MAG: hypothetical protein WCK96_05125 [Methylococcales bacterium]